jgi:hypothetical protein
LGIFSKWALFFCPRLKEKTLAGAFHREGLREDFSGAIKLNGIISFFMI